MPLGGKKYGAGAAKKVGGAANGAKSTMGGVTSGVVRGAGGVSKPVGGVVGGSLVGVAGKTTNTPNPAAKRNPLPRPHSQDSMAHSKATGLPKPYGGNNGYPSSDRKTAVKPGQSKPFTPPQQKNDGRKPYPGTNTLPGQANKVPVKRYKPAQRYEPPAKVGEAKFF